MPSVADTVWLQGINSDVTKGNSASNNGVAKVGYVNPVMIGAAVFHNSRYSFTVDGQQVPAYLSTLGFTARCGSNWETTSALLTCNGKRVFWVYENTDSGNHGDGSSCVNVTVPSAKIDLGASRISCELKLENVEHSRLPALQVTVMERLFD